MCVRMRVVSLCVKSIYLCVCILESARAVGRGRDALLVCMGVLMYRKKIQVSFAEYSLFYRALLHKRPIILRNQNLPFWCAWVCWCIKIMYSCNLYLFIVFECIVRVCCVCKLSTFRIWQYARISAFDEPLRWLICMCCVCMCVYILFVRVVCVRFLRFESETMRTSGFDSRVGVCCSVLQCVAVCCSVSFWKVSYPRFWFISVLCVLIDMYLYCVCVLCVYTLYVCCVCIHSKCVLCVLIDMYLYCVCVLFVCVVCVYIVRVLCVYVF